MQSGMTAVPPVTESLDELRAAARTCTGCDLYKDATQTVFGEGPPESRVVMVGEQPGDVEDRRGRPFVGPAGKVLDQAVAEAGLDGSRTSVSNAGQQFTQ